jgi:5-methylcytosine-specific restriction endonuclease McrA
MKKGSKMSLESKRKMSLAKVGKPSPRRGAKLSLETRKKLSNARINFLKSKDSFGPLQDDRKKVRRERIKVYGGFHSLGEWETLKAQFNWRCPCCGKREPSVKLTRDHIIPISRGGSDNIENIQPLCASCNSLKSTNTIRYKT